MEYYTTAQLQEDIKEIGFPKKPHKPILRDTNDPALLREHIDKLEKYQADLAYYRTSMRQRDEEIGKLVEKWKCDLHAIEGSSLSRQAFDLLYDAAYDDSHAYGYSEVERTLTDLINLVEAVLAANH